MAKFRKKPVVIEASQWFQIGDHPMVHNLPPDNPNLETCGWVDTLEGGHVVTPGDWIICGVKGEFYPCKPDIFDATYEPAMSLRQMKESSMANELCPKCGSEMKHTTSLDGDSFWCQDCRIAELERQLEDRKQQLAEQAALAVVWEARAQKRQSQRDAIESELEEAKACNRGLASDQQPLIDDLRSAYSERDAALDQVVGMTATLEFYGAFGLDGGAKAREALSNTSATAQQTVERIEREALEKAWARAEKRLRDKGCADDLSRLRAAILSEEEP